MTTKRIVCLANSRMPGGTCVAGCEPDGRWIRPVTADPGRGVSFAERQCEDGSDIELLDILQVPLLEPKPRGHHSENWLLDPDYRWVKQARCHWSVLSRLAQPAGILWKNEYHSTAGINDRVPEDLAVNLPGSLMLIYVDNLNVEASVSYGKTRIRGCFDFDGAEYRLRVTDPDVESSYQEPGSYGFSRCYVTLSLAEPFDDGFCYKLIAAVIPEPRLPTR